MSTTISFKPKQTTKRLLSVLPDRAREIIIKRYGLGKNTEKMTLDAIGKLYGITRERVRQIKEKAIRRLRHTSRSKLLKSYLG